MCVLEIFYLLQIHLVQIVAKHCVVEIYEFSQVSMSDVGSIILAEIRGTSKLNLYHSEFLAGSSLTGIDFKIDLFNVQYYKLNQTVTAANGSKHILPVLLRCNLVSAHRLNINNVDSCGQLEY